MADRDPVQPLHQPVLPVFEEEEAWVEHAAERFEDAAAEDLLAGALGALHPRAGTGPSGGRMGGGGGWSMPRSGSRTPRPRTSWRGRSSASTPGSRSARPE